MENEGFVKQNERGKMKLPLDENKRVGRQYLELVLNKPMRLVISDGRLLIGQFLCTDRDKNIILGSCQEFVNVDAEGREEPRMLGLAMFPGRHVVSMHIDIDESLESELHEIEGKLNSDVIISSDNCITENVLIEENKDKTNEDVSSNDTVNSAESHGDKND